MEDFVEGNHAWEEWYQDLRRRNRIAVEESRLREIARLEDEIRRLEASIQSKGPCPPLDEPTDPLNVDNQVCSSSNFIPTLLPIVDESYEGSQGEIALEEKKLDIVDQGIPRSLLPYKVKAIPDDFEQPMFIFKYGVLAKWHEAPQDEVEISLPTPPFCCGGDAQPSQPMKRKRYDDEVCIFSIYLPLCMPDGAQEDEWVKPWSIHSGRFKLLHMMPPDDIPRFPPPEEPPDPPIPPNKDEPG